jgi:hypothetical protein
MAAMSESFHWRQRLKKSAPLPVWDLIPLEGKPHAHATIYSAGTSYVLQTCYNPAAGFPWKEHGTRETLAEAQEDGRVAVEQQMAGAGR